MGREIEAAITDTTRLIECLIADYRDILAQLIGDRQELINKALNNFQLIAKVKELEDEIQSMSFITVGVPHGTEETDQKQSFTVPETSPLCGEGRVQRSMEADNGF